MAIGDRIKILRKKQGLTQDELASKLNTTKQTVHKYENNIITNIPVEKIEELAKIFNVRPSYLMGWDDDEEVHTIAAHHNEEEWTEEELDEIEEFKKYVLSKRKK